MAAEGRKGKRLLISESLRLRNCVVPSARTLCQYPTSCRSPAPGRRSAEERKAGLKFTFRQTGNANLKLTFDPTKLEISHQSHQVRDDQDDQEQAGGGGEGWERNRLRRRKTSVTRGLLHIFGFDPILPSG